MNKLSTEERKAVVAALVEGNSLRAVTRITGVHRTTVMKLLSDPDVARNTGDGSWRCRSCLDS